MERGAEQQIGGDRSVFFTAGLFLFFSFFLVILKKKRNKRETALVYELAAENSRGNFYRILRKEHGNTRVWQETRRPTAGKTKI